MDLGDAAPRDRCRQFRILDLLGVGDHLLSASEAKLWRGAPR
jgi:hypothetical protein